MRGVNVVALMATFAIAAFGEITVPARAQAPAVTAFEGARLIVGNGRPSIENATLVVEGTKIAQAGPAIDVRVPEGAARVNLSGKTVMPTLIDTHTHLSQTREGLTQDLKRRAYYGVSAALSMGTDETEAELQMRGETAPGMARVFTAWRGITRP
jgi:imidazolonepropionase-like amidohydrolase